MQMEELPLSDKEHAVQMAAEFELPPEGQKELPSEEAVRMETEVI